MQKGKLIEQIAALINDKKLPILADVRDESDAEIRIVLEPRSRTVDRAGADGRAVPADRPRDARAAQPQRARHGAHAAGDEPARGAGGLGRAPVRRAARRTEHRLAKIADRLELLDGYLIAYLNLDRVIEIIRTEDEPKAVMIAEFDLTDRQAEAILNMRLRSLRRLEELEIAGERDKLDKEQAELAALLGSPEASSATRMKRDLAQDPRSLRRRRRRSASGARRSRKRRRPATSRWRR